MNFKPFSFFILSMTTSFAFHNWDYSHYCPCNSDIVNTKCITISYFSFFSNKILVGVEVKYVTCVGATYTWYEPQAHRLV